MTDLRTGSEGDAAAEDRSLRLHEAESLKLLHDHIKSLWTLSAGGLPLVIGFFGYALQNGPLTGFTKFALPVVCLLALVSFLLSIHSGILAQRKLLYVLRTSELRSYREDFQEKNGELEVREKESKVDASEEDETMDLYDRERRSFFVGAYLLLASPLLFLIFGPWTQKQHDRSLTVALRNVQLVTQNSYGFEIDDSSFRIALPTAAASELIEIRDVSINVRAIGSAGRAGTEKKTPTDPRSPESK